MPHKLHNTIRLGRSNRLAIWNLKRVQAAALIAGFATLGFVLLAVGFYK